MTKPGSTAPGEGVDYLARAIARAERRAATGNAYVEGSIYEGMEACVARSGRTIAHVRRYADAVEIAAALSPSLPIGGETSGENDYAAAAARIVRDFRSSGWPAKEQEIARYLEHHFALRSNTGAASDGKRRELVAEIDVEMDGVESGWADRRGELLFRCRDLLALPTAPPARPSTAVVSGGVEAMREALEPFARIAASILRDERRKDRHDSRPWVYRADGTTITYGDLRRARAALNQEPTA